jgi:hypothetical protein
MDVRGAQLRKAISAAGFSEGPAEGQRDSVLDRLTGALAVYDWQTGQGRQDPDIHPDQLRPSARKLLKGSGTEGKHIAGVIKAASALREHLRALPADVQIRLGMPPVEIQPQDGDQVFVPLDPLKELIERAERMLQQRTGGRPANEALEGLLLAITAQWRCAFDDRGIVYNGTALDDSERYHGRLLDFALDVLKGQRVPYGERSALGRRLYDLTKKWGMSRHENPPPNSH